MALADFIDFASILARCRAVAVLRSGDGRAGASSGAGAVFGVTGLLAVALGSEIYTQKTLHTALNIIAFIVLFLCWNGNTDTSQVRQLGFDLTDPSASTDRVGVGAIGRVAGFDAFVSVAGEALFAITKLCWGYS